MLFLTSLEKFTKKELIDLVAFAENINLFTGMKEVTNRWAIKIKPLFETSSKGLMNLFNTLAKGRTKKKTKLGKPKVGLFEAVADVINEKVVEKFDKFEIEPSPTQKKIEKARNELKKYKKEELRQKLLDNVIKLGKVKAQDDPEIIAENILRKVAKHYKIKIEMVTPEDVERIFFEKFLEEQIKNIQAYLKRATEETHQQLEEELRKLLDQMSKGEQDAIRKAMNLDSLSADAIMNFFKSGATVGSVLLLMEASGFGIFLATTTMIKAISLLLGITIGFETYVLFTTFLGFLLSPIGAALIFTFIGTTVGGIQHLKVKRTLLCGIVATMHAKLIT